jgi:hypothetical protein
MYEDFLFWITSLVEDDPIPHEIKHLYFLISFKNNICSLSFAGSEIFYNPLYNFEFYPLEAYFFKNESFNNIKEIYVAKSAVKDLLEKSLENFYFAQIFKGKSVHVCEREKQVDYTLNL